jgi:pimeloyl-ACP methyl ester carboxylesterase
MSDLQVITEAFEIFKNHYANRLGRVETEPLDFKNIKTQFIVKSEKLRDGNYPTVFFHGQKTKDVIVLTHGLTDSPYYMKAIGERFYREGLNVILPLLPAHGLKDPDEAMDDKALNDYALSSEKLMAAELTQA